MIQSKADLVEYLEADRIALGKQAKKPDIFGDDIWRFLIVLRKLEYFVNCPPPAWRKFELLLTKLRYQRQSMKLGYTIPLNTCGPGLALPHVGTIVINGKARVGKNCRIHVCVNIGASAEDGSAVPKLGDNIYIGPGAKIFGDITIADDIAVGANAVVNKSFTEPRITIAGSPARKISSQSSGIRERIERLRKAANS